MKKGIVMEIKKGYLIMMTPNGEFLKGKKVHTHQYTVGEELDFFPIIEDEKITDWRKVFEWFRWKPSITVLSVVILALSFMIPSFLIEEEVYAYVSVDINPSIELSLDENQEVMDIKPYNDDGANVLARLSDWQGKSMKEVTVKIIKISDDLGYLTEHHTINITSVFTEDVSTVEKEALENTVQKITQENITNKAPNIVIHEATIVEREKAIEEGVSVGKLIVEKEKASIPAGISPKENVPNKLEKENQKHNSANTNGKSQKENKGNNGSNGNGQANGKQKGHGNNENKKPSLNKNKENNNNNGTEKDNNGKGNNKGTEKNNNGNNKEKKNKDNKKEEKQAEKHERMSEDRHERGNHSNKNNHSEKLEKNDHKQNKKENHPHHKE